MNRFAIRLVVAALFAVGITAPALAELKPGAAAPDFAVPASLAGKDYAFSLDEALKQGPVVVYFYPKAFTKGCTVEAHQFAAAMEQFKALNASVIGLSHDDLDTLHKFSETECGGKFPVGSDADRKVMKAYDAQMPVVGMASRTSYVITPDHKIYYTYSAMSPAEHVSNTLGAIKQWKAQQAQP